MYKPTHFILQELVDESTYAEMGDRAWWLLDDRILRSADQLRGKFGPVVVNNWHRGGVFQNSGFRSPNCGIGAANSQHKFGRALDLKFTLASPDEVRAYILDNPDEFPFINAIELGTPSWVHIDCRSCERIKTFNP